MRVVRRKQRREATGGKARTAGLSRGGRTAASLSAGAAVALTLPGMPALGNPTGGQVVAGAASITQPSAGTVKITQSSEQAIINWQDFSIGAGQRTLFFDPNSSAVTLNRVLGGDPSLIAGQLWSNGQIMLVNPSGILFANGSQVDVNGLVATTSDIHNADFMAGRFNFDIAPTRPGASVVNRGTMTIGQAGLAALVAPSVANAGAINAKLGKVVLGGAETFVVDLYGDGLVSLDASSAVKQVPVGGAAGGALVSNTGQISADGGHILLTADAAYGLVTNLVAAGGTIDARAFGSQTGRVDVSALGGGALLTGTIDVSGLGPSQLGGSASVTGETVTLATTAAIDARGSAGGGTVKIGGGRHGKDPTVTDARTTTVASGAWIDASAVDRGTGGSVTIWSDQVTRFAGTILASGGALGGNGGFVETSGETLSFAGGHVETTAPFGRTGTWLLDPTDLTIDAANVGTLESELPGTNILVSASGNITVSAPIVGRAGFGSLGLEAGQTIALGAGIDYSLVTGQTVALVAGGSIMNTGAGGTILLGSGDTLSLNAVGGIGIGSNPILVGGTGNLAAINGAGGTPAGGIFIADRAAGTVLVIDAAGFIGTASALSNAGATSVGTVDGVQELASGGLVLDMPLGTLDLASGSIAGGGAVTLEALALNTGIGEAISAPGTIILRADTMALGGPVQESGTRGEVVLEPLTAGRAIDVGGTPSTGLALSTADLSQISSPLLVIGNPADTGPLTVTGILSAGASNALQSVTSLTLESNGSIGLGAPVDLAAGGVLTLASSGRVDGTGGALQSLAPGGVSLVLQGGGSFLLNNPGNQIATVAGSVGFLTLVDGAPLTIGTLDGIAGLTASGLVSLTESGTSPGVAGITFAAPLTMAPAGLLVLNTVGTVDADAVPLGVTGNGTGLSVDLLGGGTFDLTNAGNRIASIAGRVGTLDLLDATSLTIGTVDATVGLGATGDITLSASAGNAITLAQPVTSGGAGAVVTLQADAVSLGAALQSTGSAGSVVIEPFSTGLAINLGGTPTTGLALGTTDLNEITATSLLIGGNADTGTLTVTGGLTTLPAGALAHIADLDLRGGVGTIDVTKPIALGTGALTLQADSLDITGTVTAATVTLEPFTTGLDVTVGGNSATGFLVSSAALGDITAGTLIIGSAADTAPLTVQGTVGARSLDLISGDGGIDLAGQLTLSAGLDLATAGPITQTAGSISTPVLTASTTGGAIQLIDVTGSGTTTVSLTTAGAFAASLTESNAATVDATVGGALTVIDAGQALALSGSAASATVTAGSISFGSFAAGTTLTAEATTGLISVARDISARTLISFTADAMVFDAGITAPTVALAPFTLDRPVRLGGTIDPGADLFLSTDTLTSLSANSLIIGTTADTGLLSVIGALTNFPAELTNLTLESGTGGIALAADVTVGGALALDTAGAISQTAGSLTTTDLDAVGKSISLTGVAAPTVSLSSTSSATLIDTETVTLSAAVTGALGATVTGGGTLTVDGTAGSATLGAATIDLGNFAATTTLAATASGAGGIALDGTVSAGSKATLVSSGGILQSGGVLSTPVLDASATGGGISLIDVTSATGLSTVSLTSGFAATLVDTVSTDLTARVGGLDATSTGTLTVSGQASSAILRAGAISLGTFDLATSLSADATGSGGIALTGALTAGTQATLTSAGGITQSSGSISTPSLIASATGGAIVLTDVTGSTPTTVSLTTASGLDATLDDRSLLATTVKASVGGLLTVDSLSAALDLSGSAGSATLSAPSIDLTGFATGTVLTAQATTGPLTVSQLVSAGTSMTLVANTLVLDAGIQAPSVTLMPATASLPINLGGISDPGFDFFVGFAAFNEISASSLVIGGPSETGRLSVIGALGTFPTLTLENGTAGIGLGDDVTVTQALILQTKGAIEQTAGTISAPALQASGSTIDLTAVTAPANSIVSLTSGSSAQLTDAASTVLTAAVQGALTVDGTGNLTVGGSAGSASITAGAIDFGTFQLGSTLAATATGGAIDVTGALDARSAVSFTADLMSFTAGITAASVTLAPETTGRAIALGGSTDPGRDLFLSQADLAEITAPALLIGAVADSGRLAVVGPASLPANLTLQGGTGNLGFGADLTVGGKLVIDTEGTVDQTTGTITTPTLAVNAATIDLTSVTAPGISTVSLTSTGAAALTDSASTVLSVKVLGDLTADVTGTGSLDVTGAAGSAGLVAGSIDLGNFTVGTTLSARSSGTGGITLAGTIVAGTSATLTAGGGIQQTSGVLSTPSLFATADGGNIALDDVTAPAGISSVSLAASGSAGLTDSAPTLLSTAVAGALTASSAVSLEIAGDAGSAALTAPSLVINGFSVGSTLDARALGAGGIVVDGTASAETLASLVSAGAVTVSGSLTAPVVQATANGGAIDLTGDLSAATSATLTASGAIDQRAGTVSTPILDAIAKGGGIAFVNVTAPGALSTVRLTTGSDASLVDQAPTLLISAVGGTLSATGAGRLEVEGKAGTATLDADSLALDVLTIGTTLSADATGPGGIAVDGAVTAGGSATLVSAGGINVTGSVATPVLQLSANGGDIDLTGGLTATNSVTLTAQGAIDQSAGLISTPVLTATANGGAIQLAGVTAPHGLSTVSLTGVAGVSLIDAQATDLTVAAGGPLNAIVSGVLTINGSAGSATLAAWGIDFGAFDVGTTLLASVDTAAGIKLNGALNAGQSVELVSAGDILQTAGLLTTPRLTATTTAGQIVFTDVAVPAVTLAATSGASVIDAESTSLAASVGGALDATVSGVLTLTGHAGSAALSADSIDLGPFAAAGTLTAQATTGDIVGSGAVSAGGPMTLQAAGSIEQSSGTITTPDLVADAAGGSIDLKAVTAAAVTLTTPAKASLVDTVSTSLTASVGGLLTARDTQTLSLAGMAGSASLNAAALDLGSLQVQLELAGEATGSGGITVVGTVSTGDSLSLVTLAGAPLTVAAGGSLRSQSGDVALGTFGGTGGNLQIAGAVAAPDGTVYLNAAGGIGATGSVTGTTILVDAAGAVEIGPGGTLDATQNLWIGYGASGASAAFSGLGVTPAATVGGTTTVAGTADAGDDVGLRSTSGIDIAGSVLAGDWVFLDTAGSIIDTGLVSGIGGVSLNAGGSIDEVATGALIAGTLEGSSGGYTRLDGPANQVSVLAGFTTGGSTTGTSLGTGFSLNDTASLTLQRHAMMASLVEEDGLPVDSFAATSSGLVTVGLGSLAIDVFGRHLSLTQDNRTAFIAKHGKILLSAPSFVQLGIGTFEAPLTVVDVTGDAFAGSGAIQLPAYDPTRDLGAYVTETSALLSKGRLTQGTITFADETTSSALLLVGDDSMMKGVLDVGELAVIARGGTADFTGLIHGYTGQTAASDQQFARQCANAAGGACTDLSNDLKFNNCAIGSPSCVPLPTVVVIQPPTINESALEPQSGKLDEIDVEPVNTGREDAY